MIEATMVAATMVEPATTVAAAVAATTAATTTKQPVPVKSTSTCGKERLKKCESRIRERYVNNGSTSCSCI